MSTVGAKQQKLTNKHNKTGFEALPYDVQEEIECLYEFVPEVGEHFEIVDKIGEGTFSSVFLAGLKNHPEIPQLFALKHIIPTSHPSRIEGELKCLLEIGGQDNVMGVELCLRNRDHVVIVMQYFPHEKFQDYILRMSFQEVHNYIKNLLMALKRVHQFDIIHRDIKPSNFLYDSKNKRYALVDFGLAHKAPVQKRSFDSSQTPVTTHKKGILTPSQDHLNQANTPETVNLKPPMDSNFKSRQYTPPTPNLSNSVFAKRIKSPRRLLLAKRALQIKERDQRLLQKNSASGSLSMTSMTACQCYEKPQICSICSSRSNQVAPRAGTPGFRSPEVLMKCPDQSTAVDIWSAGVIFLSLLSGRYPFFRANDDMTALAQIISIMGSDAVKQAASACGKNLICSPSQQAADLKTMCVKLRTAPMSRLSKSSSAQSVEVEKSWRTIPDSAFDLLRGLLDLNPYTRITAEEALKHPFFTESL